MLNPERRSTGEGFGTEGFELHRDMRDRRAFRGPEGETVEGEGMKSKPRLIERALRTRSVILMGYFHHRICPRQSESGSRPSAATRNAGKSSAPIHRLIRQRDVR